MLSDKAVRISQKRKELKAPESDGWEALFVPDFSTDGHMVGESTVFQKPNGDEIVIQERGVVAERRSLCVHVDPLHRRRPGGQRCRPFSRLVENRILRSHRVLSFRDIRTGAVDLQAAEGVNGSD
ncbi:hypothetical protein CKO51_13405 [Rhodopirellula sp. SM50]|nr:hypothetical protein CKO51_13405 [Rhodopirellula sp. SM50]